MEFQELETDRLYLKNISSDDTEFIFTEFSNAAVNEFLYDEEPVSDWAGAEEIVQFYIGPEPRDRHRWILVRKSDGVKLGTCGFHRWDREKGIIELGYDMLPDFWGHGYMQEAMNSILKFAKEKLAIKRVDAHIYSENEKSAALARKTGFQFYGETVCYRFREHDYIHSVYSYCN